MQRTKGKYQQTQQAGPSEGEPTESPDAEDEGTQNLPPDALFAVLANRRRRAVIRHLQENDGEATVRHLAEWIAAEENGKPVQQLSSSERKCVYVALYQNHLPMMDDRGMIDYDDNRKTVQLREAATQTEPYLDETEDSTSGRAVGGAAILVAICMALGALQVGVFGLVTLPWWTGLGLVTLLSMAMLDGLHGFRG